MDEPKVVGNERGSTFAEVIFAAAIVAGLAVSILSFSSRLRTNLVTLSSNSECQSTATSILSSIKGLDNAKVVRTFIPTRDLAAVNHEVAGTTSDPYCKTAGREAVCDTYNVLNMPGGIIMQNTPMYNSQNIRGAATWAQSVFNRFVPTICTGEGSSFSRTELERILPNQLPLPPWLQTAYLYIREEGIGAVSCNVASVSKIGANSSNDYEVGVKLAGAGKDCETKGRVSFPYDKDPTTLTVTMTNGNDVPITNVPTGTPACTCRLTAQEVIDAGGVCPGMTDVKIALRSSEPGTVLLCRRNAPVGEVDNINEWKSCGDLIYTGSTSSFSPDLRSNVVYNQPLQTTWTLSSLANSPTGDWYDIGIRDVDVGGNITPASTRFRVDSASCPLRSTYCPNASSTGAGIFFQPRDDCDVDLCPTGTHSTCDSAIAATVCTGNTYPDDCNNNVCPGEMDCTPPPTGSCIADNQLCGENGSECSVSSYYNCADCCSRNGWYQHDTGYLPYNTNCPGSCGMTGPKYRRYLCQPTSGMPSPSSGTPESCGSTPPPPPPPPSGPPWSWMAGMYQCTDTNGRKNCSWNNIGAGVIPATGYSRYELDIDVRVVAHDGSASEMFVNVDITICSGSICDTFSRSADPLYSPKNVERPMWSGTIGVTAAGTPRVSIRTGVDEATTKTSVTVRAVP